MSQELGTINSQTLVALGTDVDNLQTQIDAIVPANQLITGGVSYTGSGFTYDVSALLYRIQGTIYTTAPTQVTLNASDPTNDRIDVIYADDTGAVGVITGTPAPSPTKPNVNSLTQVEVTFVNVSAGSTTPSVTITLVYNEDTGAPTEWNGTSDDINVDFASIADPYSGSVSVETLSALGTNREIIFTPSAPYTNNGGYVTFRLKAKVDMSAPSGVLYVGFFNSGSLVGNSVQVGGTSTLTYGFDATDTSQYQLVTIPISAFGSLPASLDAIRFFKLTGTTTANFFLDFIQIQDGTPTPPPTTTGHTIQDEGVDLTQRAYLNFVGAGVTATDDPVNDATIVTINQGITGSGTTDRVVRWTSASTIGDGSLQDSSIGRIGLNETPVFLQMFSITTDSNAQFGLRVTAQNSLIQNIGINTTASGASQSVGIQAVGGGSSVESYAGQFRADTSSAGDNYGIKITTANAGAGNHYGIQILDGTEGAGKVLTSDASGRGTWQTAGGGGGWNPPNISIGQWLNNGASSFANTNAGFHRSFSQVANDEILTEVTLRNNGNDYDGSVLSFRIHWQLFNTTPTGGDNVIWELDAVLVANTENAEAKTATLISTTIDVSARSANQLYTDTLSASLAGLAGAKILGLTLRRRSSGGGADTYPSACDVYGFEIV
jgi:hypothetical protein